MGTSASDKIPRKDWKARCLEAESALEACSKALDLVPIGPLEAGQTWIPSTIAIHLLKRAKDEVNIFIGRHWHNAGGRP
jgi:hypothetical protein